MVVGWSVGKSQQIEDMCLGEKEGIRDLHESQME